MPSPSLELHILADPHCTSDDKFMIQKTVSFSCNLPDLLGASSVRLL